MNHQCISEIFFEENHCVPPHQTARSLFLRLPHGLGYAQALVDCLATSYLIAVVESICMREMQRHIDLEEVVVGRGVHIDHVGPVPPMSCVRLSGWVVQLGGRSATFFVQAKDDHEVVFEGTVILVAAKRALIEARIDAKISSLRCARTPAAIEVTPQATNDHHLDAEPVDAAR